MGFRNIVNYIRSCFCKHQWEYEEREYEYKRYNWRIKTGVKVSATCKICGWHICYDKFK